MKEKQHNTNFLHEIFRTRWQTYQDELKRCQAEATEEAVHDLRVATRRLLALIDLLRAVVPHPHFKNLRRMLKNQLDDLDDLRDTQVMLAETSESLIELPEIETFVKFLNKRERRLLSLTAKSIKSFEYSSFRKQMEAIRKKILMQKLDTVFNNLILQTVDDQFGVVIRRYQRVDPANPATIHRMRIAFKKFRYMVEITHALIPNYPDNTFNLMNDYQGMMGDIQDAKVLLSTFEDFADRDTSYDPKPVFHYYQQRYNQLVNVFIENMYQINTFWRMGPESLFPWESE